MDLGILLSQMQALLCDHIHVQPREADVIDLESGMVLTFAFSPPAFIHVLLLLLLLLLLVL